MKPMTPAQVEALQFFLKLADMVPGSRRCREFLRNRPTDERTIRSLKTRGYLGSLPDNRDAVVITKEGREAHARESGWL